MTDSSTKNNGSDTGGIKLRGVIADPPSSPTIDGNGVGITKSFSVCPAGVNRDTSVVSTVALEGDEVVRIEFEGGLELWTRADDFVRDYGVVTTTRDGEVAWDIPPIVPGRLRHDVDSSVERGAVGIGIKVLEFFGVSVTAGVADKLSGAYESKKLGRQPGLYKIDSDAHGKPNLVSTTSITNDSTIPGPALLFLHGTVSSFRGSFGALWEPDSDKSVEAADVFRRQMSERYQASVYAFEHRSLTQSPIQNALEVLYGMPDGLEVHIVSHSRGGLIGELLCLGQRDHLNDPLNKDSLEQLFAGDQTIAEQIGLDPLDQGKAKTRDQAYGADRKRLAELLALLDKKRIRISRFVRVACPARGTTLASGRLDRWLSVLGLLAPTEIVGGVADFLLAVVKERTDPRTLPGLEAMMPGSALTRLLNYPGLKTDADLTVIAGDAEGGSRWSKLKLFALDWFYSSDHDFVVNTGSMFGGMSRPSNKARYQRDEGPEVSHFNYFSNPQSISWLTAGLEQKEGGVAGFEPIKSAPSEQPRWRSAVRDSQRSGAARPLVIVVPGTMGSALDASDKRIWIKYLRLLTGGLGDISIDAPDVQAVDVLDDFYGPLLEHLSDSHRVEVFPYDWRASIRETAQALKLKIDGAIAEAETTGIPIRIVAHSMGGLVVRAMISDRNGGATTWQRMTSIPGSRLLMLGTPNRGSYEAVRWLLGENPTQGKLALLDFKHSMTDVIDIVRQYPGLVELLPEANVNRDWHSASTWRQLKATVGGNWPVVESRSLANAAKTWRQISSSSNDPDHMIYVAGCHPATVVDHQIVDRVSSSGKKFQFIATSHGDGTVTWASGQLPNVPTYYAQDTAHDELCRNTSNRNLFRGYLDLLNTGKTDQLPVSPPVKDRGAFGQTDRFVLPDLPLLDDLPDEQTTRGLTFGGKAPIQERQAEITSRIGVSIRHTDLRYARYPVLVGHYDGDTLVSAEAALDEQMSANGVWGPLRRQRDLGLYPGQLGTHDVFFNERPDRSPEGALVIGLGRVGELSPTQLELGVRDVALKFALGLLERDGLKKYGAIEGQTAEAADNARVSARISALHVGTSAGGLTLRESMESILRGLFAANRSLNQVKLDARVLIDEVEFLELFQDTAIAAAKQMSELVSSEEFRDQITWPAQMLEEGEGRRQRTSFDPDQSWWQRLEVSEDKDLDQLKFVLTTDMARAEESLSFGQLNLIDDFVAEVSRSARENKEVSKTLFEMLIPGRLKEMAPSQQSMVLLLDEASARFPWELLEDRWSRLGRPVAVTSGLVRQLKTSTYRTQVVHAEGETALVIGTPDLGKTNNFGDLPGARDEANEVAEKLTASRFGTEKIINGSIHQIVEKLHERDWRILHLAGHGVHNYKVSDSSPKQHTDESHLGCNERTKQKKSKFVSGMMIGADTVLTPGDIEQIRYTPELVFINCCHLGKTAGSETSFSQLAANLGVQFIRMGVRGVVCAGWAVDDKAALSFAREFYRAILSGDPFGQAVLSARQATWQAHPGSNTWGAYQCYGDPDFRLVKGKANRGSAPSSKFVSPSQLIISLENIIASLQMANGQANLQAETMARIEAALARVPSKYSIDKSDGWRRRSDVCAAIGFAYGEAEIFSEAIDWLERALKAEEGDCPIRAHEQVFNFRVRRAAKEWSALNLTQLSSKDRKVILERLTNEIQSAIVQFGELCRRAPTVERFALLGGAYKRLALIGDEGSNRGALQLMIRYYREAFDLSKQSSTYAFINWAVACLLEKNANPKDVGVAGWNEVLLTNCGRLLKAVNVTSKRDPNVWELTDVVNLHLVQQLVSGFRVDEWEAAALNISEEFKSALARGASVRQISSVRESIEFLVEMGMGSRSTAWDKDRARFLELVAASF